MTWRAILDYCLGVLGILVTGACLLAIVILFWFAIAPPVHAQLLESMVLWQLGACVHEPGDRPACITLGKPVPEGICDAMKKALIRENYPGRPVCARVLVDG